MSCYAGKLNKIGLRTASGSEQIDKILRRLQLSNVSNIYRTVDTGAIIRGHDIWPKILIKTPASGKVVSFMPRMRPRSLM